MVELNGDQVIEKQTIGEKINSFLVEMYQELVQATKSDKELTQYAMSKGGETPKTFYSNRKKWVLKYWWVMVAGFLLVIGISGGTKPRRKYAGSHHGISRFTGKPY